MSYDELELDTLGDRKTALFLIMSDTDSTFNFVIAMLQSQLFNLLCDKADDEYGGKLPVHVRCLLDEFANIGQILTREQLAVKIWGMDCDAEYNNVEVYMSFTRKKLAFVGAKTEIKAVRGIGYELRCDDV